MESSAGSPYVNRTPPEVWHYYPHHEYEGQAPSTLRRCHDLFSLAIEASLTDSEHAHVKAVSGFDGKPVFEYIGLRAEDHDKYLMRLSEDLRERASYPYWLTEEVIGNDLDTGESLTISQRFYLDHQGNFHREISQDGKRVASLVDTQTQMRLMAFLSDCRPLPMS